MSLLRSSAILRPALLSRPLVAQRAFSVSSTQRQTAQSSKPTSSEPEGPVKNQNTYVAFGAGAVAVAFLVWFMTGKPTEQKKPVPATPT